jgi:hypothetical protein
MLKDFFSAVGVRVVWTCFAAWFAFFWARATLVIWVAGVVSAEAHTKILRTTALRLNAEARRLASFADDLDVAHRLREDEAMGRLP